MIVAALALGSLALAGRALSPEAVWVTATVGAMGVAAPRERRATASATLDRPVWPAVRWLAVTGAGVAAMAVFRPDVATAFAWSSLVAALAEEAFFRRFAYAHLERFGPAVAIGVTSVLFALVHVPVYGWAVVPLDLAAGAVFGWQRWASGSWTSPAVSHLFANYIVMG